MPALTLELKPPGRRDVAWRAKNRHPSRVALEETSMPRRNRLRSPRRLREEFTRVAGGDSGHGGGAGAAGSSDGGRQSAASQPSRGVRPANGRNRDRDRDDWER